MGTYDVMQVCENGHKITHSYNNSPELRQPACDKCGANTICRCQNPECEEPIRGKYHVEGVVSVGGPDPPRNCHICGEAYPWNDKAAQFTEIDSSVLDEELVERCLSEYESGHYQSVVRTSFTVLEERVRDKGDFPQEVSGANLMLQAFNADDGSLSFGQTEGEQDGVMFLYRGAFQALRNPVSHRFVEEVDGDYARDAIHTVNLLLRLLEANGKNGGI